MQKRLILTAAVVTVLAGLGWGVRWWTHPTLLDGTSPLGNFDYDPIPIEHATVHVGVAVGPKGSEAVTLHRIAARFKVNTARATATFSLCRPRSGETAIGTVTNEPLSNYCSVVTPVTDGTRFHFSTGDGDVKEYLLMTIKPTVPGKAFIDQVSFNYSRPWKRLGQRGTETSSQEWIVRATG